VTINFPN